MSDNGDYRTLSEEIGITLHNTLGVSVTNNGWKLKKRCPITLAEVKTEGIKQWLQLNDSRKTAKEENPRIYRKNL